MNRRLGLKAIARILTGTAVALSSLGCPRPGAVWLASGDLKWQPLFGIAIDSGGFSSIGATGVVVHRCGEVPPSGVVWSIVPDTARITDGPGMPLPTRITYGETPKGFIDLVPAARLRPGCYRVTTSVPRKLRFAIGPDGLSHALE